jgi:acetyl esterase/lipase
MLLLSPGPRTAASEPQTVRLWPGRAPGASGDAPQDIPTLTVYLPSNAARPTTAIIIMPGGGYVNVAENAGPPTAAFLNTLGVAAFVLKYRVAPAYRWPIQLGDAQRAIRLVRARAAEWSVAPDRIGVAGFSSGAHLSATASTHVALGDPAAADPVDRVSSRPDFAILASAAISVASERESSRKALLGENPDRALLWSLSNETQVTPRTPPTFIFSTNADTLVPAEESVQYFLALRRAGVPAELHVFKDGQHGIAARAMQCAVTPAACTSDDVRSDWPHTLAGWLRASGLIK